jgi:hypothetical protein
MKQQPPRAAAITDSHRRGLDRASSATAARRYDLVARLPVSLIVVVAAAAGLALVHFDLGPTLAFNDDWVYAWSVAHMQLTHIRLMPQQSAVALVQVIWAWAVTLGHADPRYLRLSELPFAALAAVSSYRLARRLGAASIWAAVSGVALLCNPLYLNLATTFMSDVPYVALVLATCWAALTWMQDRKRRYLTIVLAGLCMFQRQAALLLPAAITLALLADRKRRGIERDDIVALAGLWITVAIAAALPNLTGIAPPTQSIYLARLQTIFDPIRVLQIITTAPGLIAFAAIPFAVGMWLRPTAVSNGGRAPMVAVLIALLGVVPIVTFSPLLLFPGNTWTYQGFTPALCGHKPLGMLSWIYLANELAAIGTLGVVWVARRGDWTPTTLAGGPALLLAVSASQLCVLVLPLSVFDRYFLPVVAPVLPVMAWLVSGASRQKAASIAAVAWLAVGVVVYATFEQDYQSWQVARDQAAHLAYTTNRPADVAAGYEANGVYVDLPQLNATGQVMPYQQVDNGPTHPLAVLVYSSQHDHRSGYNYSSLLASGRVVIASSCP